MLSCKEAKGYIVTCCRRPGAWPWLFIRWVNQVRGHDKKKYDKQVLLETILFKQILTIEFYFCLSWENSGEKSFGETTFYEFGECSSFGKKTTFFSSFNSNTKEASLIANFT